MPAIRLSAADHLSMRLIAARYGLNDVVLQADLAADALAVTWAFNGVRETQQLAPGYVGDRLSVVLSHATVPMICDFGEEVSA